MTTRRLNAAVAAMTMLFAVGAQAQQPAPPLTSESYTWRSVTIKGNGFIDGIVFSPVQKGLAYIHTDMGGAYRWDEDQKTWTCLTDWVAFNDWSLNQMGVETLAVDPADANRVYAGMGTYMGPSAILRSTDQGRTWHRTNVPFGMDGNGSARNSGERMMVDPNKTSILLYGTRDQGLWRSEDFGATWERLKSFPATGGAEPPMRKAGITWVVFDKTSSQPGEPTSTIYAGVMTLDANKVFRSNDAGKTWSAVPGQPGGDLLPTRAAIAPDGATLYLTYVVGQGYPGPHGVVGGGVYRITDAKSPSPTWTDISPSKGRFGWSGVTLDPRDPQSLLVSVLNRYNPTDDIYRSRDGGATWVGLNIDRNRDDSSAPYARHMGTHWVGDVQIDPLDPDHAMYTTGYGLYDTRNASADAPKWAFFNEGFEQTAVLELVSPPAGDVHLLSAIGDRDGYRHEDFNVSPRHGHFGSEQKRTMGTCRELDIAWQDPNVVVRVGNRLQYSMDGGITWEWFAGEQQAGGRRGRMNIAVAADAQTVVWSSDAGTSYATRDGGGWSEWKPAANALPNMNIVADLVNGKRLYGQSDRQCLQSLDGGMTWSAMSEPAPHRFFWIRATLGQEGHLWGSARENGMYRSADGGKSWSQVAPGVVTNANHIGVGAAAPGGSYPAIYVNGLVAGQPGFFRSDDQGETWVRINDDQHHYGNPSVIQGDSRVYGRLYVGANGRGILYGERQTPAR